VARSLTPTSFDPRQTLAGVAETAREHTDAKSLVLNCEIDPRSPQRVIGDEEDPAGAPRS
jgi:hypothetical protein